MLTLHIPLCTRLTALDELDCSFNEIEALPTSIGQCVNIRTFAADHNFLTHLPTEVTVYLQIIILINNTLTEFYQFMTLVSTITDGKLEECNCAVPTFQQAGVFA